MTVLGKFTKQPREVQTYAIQFAGDMTPTDHITGGYSALALDKAIETDLTTAYTVTTADNNKLFYTASNVTLPGTASDGFVVMVSNTSQSSQITVGAFAVPARGCIIVRRLAGAWVSEMAGTTVLVDAAGDQRVRIRVVGGVNGTTYKGQLSATTAEGNVFEDEMTIKIKET